MKLSEMQSSPDVGRPEREFPICVSGRLVAELEAADRDLFGIEEKLEAARAESRRRQEGDAAPPRRTGATSPLPDLERQAQEAAERCDAIRARMEEHTITLHLRGKSNSEWRQWAARHPVRDEDGDPAGYKRDLRHAGGFCDIDALAADAGRWVVRYGDEEPTDGAWQFVADNAAPGDLTRLASVLVGMHEQVVDLGKSRAAWLSARRSATDSE